MRAEPASVLAINGGSSSIKFALFGSGEPLRRLLWGKIDRIGQPGTRLSWEAEEGASPGLQSLLTGDHRAATNFLIDWLESQAAFGSIRAVGHRVVHGMSHTEPEVITPDLLEELKRLAPYDPEHLPSEIDLIEEFRRRQPDRPQVACFDTTFHRSMPRVAKMLPLPRRYDARGVQRYGFHGLSYAFLVEELARLAGPQAAEGRVILAHLGSGASLAAVRGGHSIDTSMGFTPASGIPMSTRAGDLDPGLARYLKRTESLTTELFSDMINHQSGLLGISETSSDMRDLLAREASDVRAHEAVALFCYQAKKWVGAYAAALGGLDTLIFSAGIGENCPPVRARICDGLGFLGLELDPARNAQNAPVISTPSSRVEVRVIPTDEEGMIARSVDRLLGPVGKSG